MKKKCIILQGVSGSGKSTYAHTLLKEWDEKTQEQYEKTLPEDVRRMKEEESPVWQLHAWERGIAAPCPEGFIVSADDFFTHEVNKNGLLVSGVYVFDPAFLGEAHATCLRNFIGCVWMEVEAPDYDNHHCGTVPPGMVIVDNTNCSAVEIAPYLAIAQAYEYEVSIHRIKCELADAIERAEKGPHKTPAKVVLGQWRTLKCFDPPPWWPAVVEVEVTR